MLPKRRFSNDWQKRKSGFLCSQTKIWDGGTKDEIRISKEALFKGVSTRFGLRTIEQSVETPDFIFCSSFPNLRSGSITFQWLEAQIEYSRPWKSLPSKSGFHLLFLHPKSSFGMDTLWEGVSTRLGRRIVAKCIEKCSTELMLPKRRFGKAERTFCRPFRMRFRSTFQGCDYRIWAKNRWKVLRKRIRKGLQKVRSAFPNLRVGGVNFVLSSKIVLCSPNEDFGRPNQHFRARVRSTFRRFVAQIWYSQPWKVMRKSALKCWFGLPKSSFGYVWGSMSLKKKNNYYTIMRSPIQRSGPRSPNRSSARMHVGGTVFLGKFMAPKRRFWNE